MFISANDSAVEISKAVDLSAAEKTYRNPSALQPVAEHFGNADGCQRSLAQFAVADRKRQHFGFGCQCSGLVNERDTGRVGQPRQIAPRGWKTNTDETDIVIGQRACGGDGHQFGSRISHGISTWPDDRLRSSASRPKSGLDHERSRPTPSKKNCHVCNNRARKTARRLLALQPLR